VSWTPREDSTDEYRHGARLDAADPAWHLSCPTPYDSPLTFGGWNQSRLLGGRIASILKAGKFAARPGARVRVVMHSSPFLRCLQTSIGIAAGIAESSTSVSQPAEEDERARPRFRDHLFAIAEPDNEDETDVSEPVIEKPLLRVDAFLGEWLSPDYFEQITPPPETPLMLMSAKATLLAEDHADLSQQVPVGNFPGGWSRDGQKGSSDNLTRQRSNTFSERPAGDIHSTLHVSPDSKLTQTYYNPPIPTFAVNSSDPIPAGFVSYARESCVDVDLGWDSSREPLNWGDGGNLGEEWSDLHKRIRKGVTSAISWYSLHPSGLEYDAMCPPDENVMVVVILVTHSSGCNALIGALTNQPVLMDVGQASLTIAAKRPQMPANAQELSKVYEVNIKASVDHLRKKSDPSVSKGNGLAVPNSRSNRSLSSTRRPYQNAVNPPVRTWSVDGQATQQPTFSGLWGKAPVVEQRASQSKMWGSGNTQGGSKLPLQPVSATDIDSEAGAPRMWTEERQVAKRRWTTTEEPHL
jgi:broad specificity phosphatase PhoE